MLHETPTPEHLTPFRSNRHGTEIIGPSCTLPRYEHIDVAALAAAYHEPLVSSFNRQALLEEARLALTKYELAEDELEIAADSLAKTMQMLLEQDGIRHFPPQRMAALERDVLDWCGLSQ